MQIGIPEIEQKYELLEKLGEGGMGSVYKARHRLLEEVRVIKTVKPQLQQDEDLQNRFRREAQVAAKMRHPHIATLYDAEVLADGSAYLVMDFIAGENIRDYVRKGGGLTLQQVVDIGRQGLSALAYLHGQSFVHRDISSDNMMLSWQDGEPHVTLIDLGLAKNLGGSQWQTKTGMVVGKVRYISPEQLNSGFDGAEVDARSDLYSFGVVLYELLTGEYPIVGQDDMSLIAGHLYREPRPFDETDPNSKIPPALRSVVLKALEKKRGDRFASAGDLSEALGKALESYFTQPVQLPPDEQPTVQLSGGRVAEAAQGAGASPEVAGRGLVDVRSPGGETRATHRASDAETARVGGAGRQTVPVDMDAETAPIFLPPGSTAAVPPPDGTTADTRAHGPAPAEAKSPGSKKGLAAAAVVVLALVGAWFAGVFDRSDRDSVASSPATAPEGASAADATGEGVFFGQFHALVIGIDNYQQLPRLETAISDARAIGRVLENRYGFEVTLLEDPDRETIVNTLSDLASRLTGRDNLLVYYAGHGQLQGRAPYWQPIDSQPANSTRWISTRYEITQMLDESEARHVLVVADSCYAGATSDARMPEGLGGAAGDGGRGEEIRELARRPSRMVLASGGLAPVLDQGRGRHSVFASALLDALKDNDGPLEASALFERIRPQVEASARALGAEQEPVLAPISGGRDEGGELFFVPVEGNGAAAG